MQSEVSYLFRLAVKRNQDSVNCYYYISTYHNPLIMYVSNASVKTPFT